VTIVGSPARSEDEAVLAEGIILAFFSRSTSRSSWRLVVEPYGRLYVCPGTEQRDLGSGIPP
jgi:hypothetical protein